MNRKEHLLTILAEECVETAQRASKCLRFSMEEIQPGQGMTNEERLLEEYAHIVAMIEMLKDEFLNSGYNFAMHKEQKKKNVEKFLLYSKEMGTLND